MNYFQVTMDLQIYGMTTMQKAFRPGMAFIEGNIPSALLNELYLNLTFNQLDDAGLEFDITDPYLQCVNNEYSINYTDLAIDPDDSMFTGKIDHRELLVSLGTAKERAPKERLVYDQSKFIIDFLELSLKKLKENNELS